MTPVKIVKRWRSSIALVIVASGTALALYQVHDEAVAREAQQCAALGKVRAVLHDNIDNGPILSAKVTSLIPAIDDPDVRAILEELAAQAENNRTVNLKRLAAIDCAAT